MARVVGFALIVLFMCACVDGAAELKLESFVSNTPSVGSLNGAQLAPQQRTAIPDTRLEMSIAFNSAWKAEIYLKSVEGKIRQTEHEKNQTIKKTERFAKELIQCAIEKKNSITVEYILSVAKSDLKEIDEVIKKLNENQGIYIETLDSATTAAVEAIEIAMEVQNKITPTEPAQLKSTGVSTAIVQTSSSKPSQEITVTLNGTETRLSEKNSTSITAKQVESTSSRETPTSAGTASTLVSVSAMRASTQSHDSSEGFDKNSLSTFIYNRVKNAFKAEVQNEGNPSEIHEQAREVIQRADIVLYFVNISREKIDRGEKQLWIAKKMLTLHIDNCTEAIRAVDLSRATSKVPCFVLVLTLVLSLFAL